MGCRKEESGSIFRQALCHCRLPRCNKIADFKVHYTKDSGFVGHSEFHSSIRQLVADRPNPPASGNSDMTAVQSSVMLNEE